MVQPSDIDTSKFTHLNYAFAIFDSGFNVVPQNTADVALYAKFTALKSAKLQTWIAIGGGSGMTPWFVYFLGSFGTRANKKTHRSLMVSTAANRAKFITSLEAFIKKYGFQGT